MQAPSSRRTAGYRSLGYGLPAERLRRNCLTAAASYFRSLEDSSFVRAAARPQCQSSHTLALPNAASIHGQRRAGSGDLSTRSMCRRALSVEGSPSKWTLSFMFTFCQSRTFDDKLLWTAAIGAVRWCDSSSSVAGEASSPRLS